MKEMRIPNRVLMGPGPSDVDPRVLKAMSMPLLGHLDPAFLQIMNEIMEMLRRVFETENRLTVPMSGTGSSGMETLFVNLIEPGDKVIVAVNGLFGQRMVDSAQRWGAEVTQIDAEWGEIIRPEQVEKALQSQGDVKLVALVHAETSTGVLQPLREISAITHEHGALFVVDAVTSLGGIPIQVDEHKIDAAFSGTQKCLSVPPGLAPVTLNERAVEVLANRQSAIKSWYFDLSMIASYWGKERVYHHTAPINMNYALHEALRILQEEGLANVYRRHQVLGQALQNGLEAMGLALHVRQAEWRLPELTTVKIPEGVNDQEVRGELLKRYGIEIGGGIGDLGGKIWRLGLMGHSCRLRNVMALLGSLGGILKSKGVGVDIDNAIAASLETVQEKAPDLLN